MKRTLAFGLVLAAMLGGTAAARAGDFHISFGIGVGHGGHYFYRPYGFVRPYYAFRPYSYDGFRPYYPYGPYGYPFFASPAYSIYRAYPYRPYTYAPRVVRYYVAPRVYAPHYGGGSDVRYSGPDRGYTDYTPRRYRRPW